MTIWTIFGFTIACWALSIAIRIAAVFWEEHETAQPEPHIPTPAEDWDAEFERLTGQQAFPTARLNQWSCIGIGSTSVANCIITNNRIVP